MIAVNKADYKLHCVFSIVRRRAAILRVQEKTLTLMESGSIVIQAIGGGFDCTMNYLHSTADILIVQSVARRWIAIGKDIALFWF